MFGQVFCGLRRASALWYAWLQWLEPGRWAFLPYSLSVSELLSLPPGAGYEMLWPFAKLVRGCIYFSWPFAYFLFMHQACLYPVTHSVWLIIPSFMHQYSWHYIHVVAVVTLLQAISNATPAHSLQWGGSETHQYFPLKLKGLGSLSWPLIH